MYDDYQFIDIDTERQHMQEAIKIHEQVTGSKFGMVHRTLQSQYTATSDRKRRFSLRFRQLRHFICRRDGIAEHWQANHLP